MPYFAQKRTILHMILFFDTETTGLCPGNVIQLAYIMTDGQTVKGKNFFFYVPFIERAASMVHGITVEKLATLSNGHTFSEYLEEIDDDFRAASLTVAHNFPVDFNFMSHEFEQHNRRFHFKESLDTMRYFCPITKLEKARGKGYKYPKLCELAKFFDLYDYDVTRFALNLFKGSGVSHDARFDIAQTYLCTMLASEQYPEVNELLKKYY